YNLKWKTLKPWLKKLGRGHGGDVVVGEGGEWVVDKPSWRNFSLGELAVATDGFNPGNF
ncbi:hypothetical protein Tco_0077080, partial [Tanacetum coccineum]